MRITTILLVTMLLSMPHAGLTTAKPGPFIGDVDHHLIVRFKPGVWIPTVPLTKRLPTTLNRALDELAAQWGLSEIERLTPALSQPSENAQPLNQGLRLTPPAQAMTLWRAYGLDRTVLLRFARPINPQRLAALLVQRYPDLIEFAEPDSLDQPSLIPNDQFFPIQWHLNPTTLSTGERTDIFATEAWDITTGEPDVVIAVIDAGFDLDHPDLRGKLFVNPGEIPDNGIDDDLNQLVDDVIGWDFTRRDNVPEAETGHGTWVAGLAAMHTNNALDAAGVSWGSRILPLKAGDATGIYISQQVQAINYAIAMMPHGVRVINMSFGGASVNQTRELALRAAQQAGLLVVAAAGNQGADNDLTPIYPAQYSTTMDNVIAVTATDRFNRRPFFANYGRSSVDLAAPGSGIFGITARAPIPLGSETGHITWQGTSAATAIVSGIAALIYSQFPTLTPLQVKYRLRGSVDRLPDFRERTVAGGRVNALRALETDEVAPAPIRDARVLGSNDAPLLVWTATGDDDDQGQAMFYEIRYLTSPMTPDNIKLAQKLPNAPFPQPAGTVEQVILPRSLPPGTYYFIIRVWDNVGNHAESNQVVVTR
ncbi:MAG: S8 family serine peptidase [Blastocatellia bacterium]|nr:S8 family serine peptidase [Blastocatellia bacterium]